MATNDCHALSASLPYIGIFTMVGSAKLHKATNSKTTYHSCYTGSVLLDLVTSSNFMVFSQVLFYLLPTRLADEVRPQSADRELVRYLRARAGDGRRATWSFSHDHSPPKDCTFPFRCFISNTRERLAKTVKRMQFPIQK